MTNQSIRKLSNLSQFFKSNDKKKKFFSILLISIWLLISSVLTRAITGLLHNTYFNVKTIPYINTIDDIIERPELSVSGKSHDLGIWNRFGIISKEIHQNIYPRVTEYEKKLTRPFHSNDQLLTELIVGQTVILINSKEKKTFLKNNKDFSNHFQVSEHKYWPIYTYLSVFRYHPFANKMTFL